MKNVKIICSAIIGSFLSCSPTTESLNDLQTTSSESSSSPMAKTVFVQQGVWTTTESGSKKLNYSNEIVFSNQGSNRPTIEVDSRSSNRGQNIDGFGYTLTGGSAELLYKMGASQRTALLNEIFGNSNGTSIKSDVLRIAMGAEDLSRTVYTYNDIPAGQQDFALSKFNFGKDLEYKIPIIKEILKINPNIKIFATPWTAPLWMKTQYQSVGGQLNGYSNSSGNQIYFEVYAKYFVKYIQKMKEQGITIYAVTPQNEPLHDGNNPSMKMESWEQANFIKYHLGPQFDSAGITTKIIGYDHNADNAGLAYASNLLNDSQVTQYLDGTAWHLYGGQGSSIGHLSTIYNMNPKLGIYFTEQWLQNSGSWNGGDFLWHMENITIGALNNWSKTVMEWNLASDPSTSIHTNGGCTNCLGALTINNNAITRNVTYYSIAHASRFLGENARRLFPKNTGVGGISYAAFVNEQPPYDRVMLLVNSNNSKVDLNLKYINFDGNVKYSQISIEPRSAQTYVWKQ